MLSNLKISTRLILLVIAQIVVLLVISATGLITINIANERISELNQYNTDQLELSQLGTSVRTDLINTVTEIYQGVISWEEASERLDTARTNFETNWQRYLEGLSEDNREMAFDIHGPTLADIRTTFDELSTLIDSRSRNRLNLFVTNDFGELTEPYFSALQARASQLQSSSSEAFENARNERQQYLIIAMMVAIGGILLAGLLGLMIYRSIARPIRKMNSTVQQAAAGDYYARTELSGSDELAQLGRAFDELLQDKVVTLSLTEQENESINNSVINLLQAVSQLSQRDLTVRVPVTEDVTGPVSDALNLLTDETARVLSDVTKISVAVANTSTKVKQQSDQVIEVADNERREVEQAANELTEAAATMNQIADLARSSNQTAETAIQSTQTALETVINTVSGINNTRDTIRETEKRIKRLGERSQEISGAVNLINTIAERTHILALNASMHAASAGEAGRGFAVVADEVQRLAENARQATSQIATLVSNIQTETADTVNTMNTAISQVVEGSRLAEEAGSQMRQTQQTTADLVASVQQIAASSQTQAEVSNALLDRARQIQESSRQTSQRLQEQTEQTNKLVEYARALVNSVRVFKLPQPESAQKQTG